MSTFEFEQEIIAKGGDIAAIRQGWMDTSDEKGWPKTEIGLGRYLERLLSTGKFPLLTKKGESVSDPRWNTDLPERFMEWMEEFWETSTGKHDKDLNPIGKRWISMSPFAAWNTQRLRDIFREWERTHQKAQTHDPRNLKFQYGKAKQK